MTLGVCNPRGLKQGGFTSNLRPAKIIYSRRSCGVEMRRSTCTLFCMLTAGATGAIAIGPVVPAFALTQQDVDRCSGKGGVTPDQQISACTAVIQSGVYSGVDLAVAFNNRGTVYQDKRDDDHSIADYDQAIRLNPKYALAFYNRAWSYYRKKSYARAIADYDKVIALDPKDAGAYLNRGNVYSAKGDLDRAISDYGEAIRIRPDDPSAFVNRCDELVQSGQAEAALADCNEALRLRPDHAGTFLLRGNAHFALGRFEQAAADFDVVVRQNPKDVWALYGRGMAKVKKGNAADGNVDIRAAKALLSDIEEDFASFFELK